MKHSKEPWLVFDGSLIASGPNPLDGKKDYLGVFEEPSDATRAVQCVNALAGLNPDGVKVLVKACENMINNPFLDQLQIQTGVETRGNFYSLKAALKLIKGEE